MFYYDLNRTTATNASANALSTHLRALTAANQRTAAIMGLYVSARGSASAGMNIRLVTAATAGTGGTSQTPAKRDPDAPAAGTVWTNDATAITAGATPTTRQIVGASAGGGFGGWVAGALEQAVILKPNAGANGNCELASMHQATAINIECGLEMVEL